MKKLWLEDNASLGSDAGGVAAMLVGAGRVQELHLRNTGIRAEGAQYRPANRAVSSPSAAETSPGRMMHA